MFYVGLDLGQTTDPSALVVAERVQLLPVPSFEWVDDQFGRPTTKVTPAPPATYTVGWAERWPLATSYATIVAAVKARCEALRAKGGYTLVIDKTGVGRAVHDMFRAAALDPIGISIHGGDTVTREYPSSYRVPKRDLVGVTVTLFQARPRRLSILEALAEAQTLTKELLNFKLTIDPKTSHDSYAAWREGGANDDLLLALACALWYAEFHAANTTSQSNYLDQPTMSYKTFW